MSGVGMGFLVDLGFAEILAFGILFLIYYIGLRTNLEDFREVSADSINVALIQLLFVGALGFFLGTALDFGIVESFYLGMAAGLSSTLTGTDLFNDRIRMDLHHGRISAGTNFVQDVLAGIIATVVMAGSLETGFRMFFLTIMLFLTSFIVREMLSSKVHSFLDGSELKVMFVIGIFSLSVGLGLVTEFSLIATCMAGGIAFSKGREMDDVLESIEHVKDFFSVITFIGLGILVSSPSITSIYVGLGLILLVLIVKPIVTFLTLILDNHSPLTAFKTSINISEISEFVLAAAILGFLAGPVSSSILEGITVGMVFSMLFFGLLSERKYLVFELLAKPFRRLEREFFDFESIDMEDHIIVAGYSTIGQQVVKELEERGEKFVVIDYSQEKISKANNRDLNTVFGDLMENTTWERANYKDSRLVVCTSLSTEVEKKIEGLNVESISLAESNRSDKIEADYEDLVSRELREMVANIMKDKKL